ncbi:MAG: zf-HC2 domain-containing protein [Planctomycetota bacterium]
MKQDHVLDLLSARLDGELPSDDAARFDAHVAACDACRREYESFAAALAILQDEPIAPAPREHVDAVMAAVLADRGEAARRRTFPPILVLASHVAAAAVGAFVLFLVRGHDARLAPPTNGDDGRGAEMADAEHASDPNASAPAVTSTSAPSTNVPEVVERFVPFPVTVRVARSERAPAAPPIDPLRAADIESRRALARSNERLARRADALAAALDAGGRALDLLAVNASRAEERRRGAVATRRSRARRSVADLADDSRTPGTARRTPPRIDRLCAATTRGPVAVTRDGDRVVVATSGSTEEIVPALLAYLDDADPAVRAAVDRRLRGVARELGTPAPGAADPDDDAPWWRSQRARAAAEDGDEPAALPDAEAWKAWWVRTRGQVAMN